jgi:hypothetical protein
MFPNLSSFRTDYIYVLPVFVFVLELETILPPILPPPSWRFFGRKCFYFLYHGASSVCPLCSTSEYFPSPAGTAPLILLVPLVSVSYCAGRNSFRISSTSEVVRTLSAQFLSSELDSLLKLQEAVSALVEKLCVLSYSQAM